MQRDAIHYHLRKPLMILAVHNQNHVLPIHYLKDKFQQLADKQ